MATAQPSRTKVIIVGGGIAGPTLATFLKLKGYEPILYERTPDLGDRGIGHGVSQYGVKVLAKIPGLLENLEYASVNKFLTYSAVEEDKRLLLEHSAPPPPPGGFSNILIRRAVLHKTLVNSALSHGVEIKWGHKLVGLEQAQDSVTVKFENGVEDTASFVVGSDGLHSNTRICLFGQEQANYTGLVQTGGIAPVPSFVKEHGYSRALIGVYGNGMHVLAGPLNDTQMFWALTQREPETSRESWNAVDNNIAEEIRKSPAASWDYGIGELIKSTDKYTKYGLYDRPELKTWHKGRVLLIGDAAHPTSPHLGQGATQAFEDVDALIELLEKYNPSATTLSTETLDTLFTELEAQRIPRSAAMVKGARRQGEARVVQGVEACLKRNREILDIWKDGQNARNYGKPSER